MTQPNVPNEDTVRCPHCSAPNVAGAAYCEQCAMPLTAYEGGSLGPSAATIAKLQRLSTRPPVVSLVAVLLVLATVMGPLWSVLSRFRTQTDSAAPQEMYMLSAMGAVGVFLVAIVYIPLAGFLLVTAWSAWRQQPWAWTAVSILLVLSGLAGLLSFAHQPIVSVLRLGITGGIGYVWMLPATRDWFGKA